MSFRPRRGWCASRCLRPSAADSSARPRKWLTPGPRAPGVSFEGCCYGDLTEQCPIGPHEDQVARGGLAEVVNHCPVIERDAPGRRDLVHVQENGEASVLDDVGPVV